MQDSQPAPKFEINSPTFSKSVTFCFNYDQDRPLQLISWEEETGFRVNPEAIPFFESLKDDKLGVVAIVGRNRTGKSYLLNRVILNRKSGFSVGHTINPCTKGIWIWPHTIQIQDKKGEEEKVKVIVMDTEGTGATDQRDNYDTQVFMLAMMLSSYFIYNSVGAIDEKAIQNLSLIINLSKHLQKTNEKELEDLVESFPTFLWVLRDFALKLVDPKGNPITSRFIKQSKEYLENALKPQKGMSEATESKNRIRRFLTNFFKDRDCYMMVRPSEAEKDMQNLHNLELEDLRPEFNEQVINLRRKVCSKVKPKLFKGKPVNGPAFIVLCRLLCETINNGDILSMESSWNSICKIESEKLIKELSDRYENEFMLHIKNNTLTQPQMKAFHKEKREEMLVAFRKRAMGDNIKEYEEVLQSILRQKYSVIKKNQNYEIQDKLVLSFEEKCAPFETKVEEKQFQNFTDLVADFRSLKSDLEKEHSDTFSKEILSDYMLQKFFKLSEIFVHEKTFSLSRNDSLKKEQIESLEAKAAVTRQEFEAKSTKYMEEVQSLQSEKSKLKAEVASAESRFIAFEEERERLKQEYHVKIDGVKSDFQTKEQELIQQIESLQHKVKHLESEKMGIETTNAKEIAIQSQQLEFSSKQVSDLIQSVADLKKELTEEKEINKASTNALEEYKMITSTASVNFRRGLSSHIDEQEEFEHDNTHEFKRQKLERRQRKLSNEYLDLNEDGSGDERMLKDIENSELRRKVDIMTCRIEESVEGFYKQKVELLNKVREVEIYYREKKQEDESTITALKKQVRGYETTDQSMIEINKKLVLALERADLRAEGFQKKVEQLKKTQRLVKYSEKMTCKVCKQTVKKSIFLDHLQTCLQNHEQSAARITNAENINLGASVANGVNPLTETRCFRVGGAIGKNKYSVQKSLGELRDFAQSAKQELKNTEASEMLNEFDQAASNFQNDGKTEGFSQHLQQTFTSLLKTSSVRESQTLQEPFEVRRSEAPYCSIVYCNTDSIDKGSKFALSERDISNIQNRESQKRSHHSRKESNRYLKKWHDTQENEEQYEESGFNSKRRNQEHFITEENLEVELEPFHEQADQVEQGEV